MHQRPVVPFLITNVRLHQYLEDVGGDPQLWVVPVRRSGTVRVLNQVAPVFSSVYLLRKVLSSARPLELNSDAYFWLGGTGFARAMPYLRYMSAVAYLSSLSVVLRGCLGLEEAGGSMLDRGSEGGANLVNIRYKQRVLMQQLRFTLFTLSGNVPHLLNKHRLVRLAAQVGRGYLLQRCTFSMRMLLRCCKLAMRREEVAYLLHGGYVFVNGRACLSPGRQLCAGDCVQMVFNKYFLLYLVRGWLDLYKSYTGLLTSAGQGPHVHHGLSRYLYSFDDLPLGVEVDYATLTVFCLPAYVPPYEWSWALAYYLTWNNAGAYLWRYSY